MKAGAEAGAGHPAVDLYQAATGHSMDPGILGSSSDVAPASERIVFEERIATKRPWPCAVTSLLLIVWGLLHIRGECVRRFDWRINVKYANNSAAIGVFARGPDPVMNLTSRNRSVGERAGA